MKQLSSLVVDLHLILSLFSGISVSPTSEMGKKSRAIPLSPIVYTFTPFLYYGANKIQVSQREEALCHGSEDKKKKMKKKKKKKKDAVQGKVHHN
jgi:hypothetical protein